jgi:SAM-dependent methyltransferase
MSASPHEPVDEDAAAPKAVPAPRWLPAPVGGASWRLLAEHAPEPAAGAAAGEPIHVFENTADGARLYVEGDIVQSHALPGGESLVPYVRAMRDLLRLAGARRVAVLGGAGGTLATMLARHGAACVVVDVNPAAFAVGRAYFWLSPSVECVVADASAYLEVGGVDMAPFDAIVLDAYGPDGRVPAHLAGADFFGLVRRRLAPGGLVVANAYADDADDRLPDELAAAMEAAGLPSAILDGGEGEEGNNILVVGGRFFAGWLPLPRDDRAGAAWYDAERFRRCRKPRN